MRSRPVLLFAVALTLGVFKSMATADAAKETVLHSFQNNGIDGFYAQGALVQVNKLLYGTTNAGGAYNFGTVFSIDPITGTETILYSFCSQAGCPNGATPTAALISVGDTLYGTTSAGGGGVGTVFSINPETAVESVVYAFGTTLYDGRVPYAPLINAGGTLYGTTLNGGTQYTHCGGYGCGTVFSIDLSTGAEAVLHSFKATGDGEHPYAAVIDVEGVLYGTTENGDGKSGTVFSLDPSNEVETILHIFKANGSDGVLPFAGLIKVGRNLYGTTSSGGLHGANVGTVFSINRISDRESILYSFKNNQADGAAPHAGLINLGGTLYGTTCGGGVYGYGTVFSIDPSSGKEFVLHSFGNGSDGSCPVATLTGENGVLYGTTENGGTYNGGTVFKVKL